MRESEVHPLDGRHRDASGETAHRGARTRSYRGQAVRGRGASPHRRGGLRVSEVVERESAEALGLARSLLRRAERIVALTGAGVSAESGVPTFRGGGGLWKTYRAEDLATPEAFARDARLVWEWYGWRRSVVVSCAPNAAHRALAGASATRPDFRVVTQNVDGLHVTASDGVGPRPLELHGSLFR